MTDEQRLEQMACCACLRVEYKNNETFGAVTAEWWECKDCKRRFIPESQLDAARQQLADCSERINGLRHLQSLTEDNELRWMKKYENENEARQASEQREKRLYEQLCIAEDLIDKGIAREKRLREALEPGGSEP